MNPQSILAKILMIFLGIVTGSFPAFTLSREIHLEKSQEELKNANLSIFALQTQIPSPISFPTDKRDKAISYLQSIEEQNVQEIENIESLISETKGAERTFQEKIKAMAPDTPAENEVINLDEMAASKWNELNLPDSNEIEKLLVERQKILTELESDNPNLDTIRARSLQIDTRIQELSSWNTEKIEATMNKIR